MSVSTRLQAMQPTDIGIAGPSSLDMARAFRSVRADPLTFLDRGLARGTATWCRSPCRARRRCC